ARLGEGKHARRRAMGRALGKARQRGFESPGRDTSMRALQWNQLGAASEKFWAGAFIHLHMAFLMAEDHAVRGRQCGEREPVCGAARRNEKNRDLAFEDLAEAL